MAPSKKTFQIGIIGCGDMGKFYARQFVKAGWKKVNVCDIPSKYDALKAELDGTGVNVCPDGFSVSRQSDFILYSVEAALIDKVVSLYGPATKLGAIVGGQTSVKQPEIAAFEKYLPSDVHIVSCHSLHGPGVNPKGLPLVMIQHRCPDEKFAQVVSVMKCFESSMVFLTAEEHDRITADTQAITHLAFLSMGSAWKEQLQFPWENPQYIGGIENVKILMSLRIYANKWHVYAGLAIMNPSAQLQVRQYARSVSELFKLMIQEREDEFRQRLKQAADYVFGTEQRQPILLSDALLDKFSLSSIPKDQRKANSHLSLLSMVDCWYHLGIKPYEHLICQTPPFRLLLGITEYLFRNVDFLDSALTAAIHDKDIRADDMEFCSAAARWAECIEHSSMDSYRIRFEQTSDFFKERLKTAAQRSSALIESISQKTV
ncbi:uncharacterized protein BJ171DRAFT_519509 [Polychytrium aggregatum]|uniref:uncharacterized protein n=1 Tax=Polychytrium aggregatum TaxID=110093 RepID=UPI0022FE6681|nr:uncharacterized protein BJ171DRAFT_519509 [Polychytrium aggregatum]KAI9197426.1 hypothetical protein BJ171DRAFT_519509 [Polychytrium aggregatum]